MTREESKEVSTRPDRLKITAKEELIEQVKNSGFYSFIREKNAFFEPPRLAIPPNQESPVQVETNLKRYLVDVLKVAQDHYSKEPLDELYYLKTENLRDMAAEFTRQINWYRNQFKPEI